MKGIARKAFSIRLGVTKDGKLLTNKIAENHLIRLRNECKEMKIKENSKVAFVLSKNLNTALTGKTNVASRFLKAKKAIDKDYSIIKERIESGKLSEDLNDELKGEKSPSAGDELEEIPDETDRALQLIKSPTSFKYFSNRFCQHEITTDQKIITRSSYSLLKGNATEEPKNSKGAFVISFNNDSTNIIKTVLKILEMNLRLLTLSTNDDLISK